MARYIDAELLKENFAKRLNNRFGILIKIDDTAVDLGLAIADTPTADVVEVVRCKDCKESYTSKDGKLRCDKLHPSLDWVEADDFCSYGERKDANGKDKIKG